VSKHVYDDDTDVYQPLAAGTEAAVVADLAGRLAAGTRVETPTGADLVLAPSSSGGVDVIDLQDYSDLPRPTVRQHMEVYDAESFVTYLARYGSPSDAIVTVDEVRGVLSATLDAASGSGPGWRKHTLRLAARRTPEWEAWKVRNGTWTTLGDFAEHVQQQLRDFHTPEGAYWLELAQSFQAVTNAAFQQGARLATGETSFQWTEETTAKAGRSGELAIPETFELTLRPFEGAPPYRVPARFRYRLRSGDLSVCCQLDRPDLIERAAFGDFVAAVRTALGDEWAILNGPLS
jgi:uncharacterized protein YfdQ (DUF2303 family)